MLASLYRESAANAVETGPIHPADRLNLQVVFTDPEGTRGALAAAEELGRGLDAHVTLIVAQVVPYPLPLDEPVVASPFTQNTLLKFLTGQESDTCARVYLCRDRVAAIREALAPKSIVLLGGRTHWWRTAPERLARTLERAGHKVIFIDSSQLCANPAVAATLENLKHEPIDFHS